MKKLRLVGEKREKCGDRGMGMLVEWTEKWRREGERVGEMRGRVMEK